MILWNFNKKFLLKSAVSSLLLIGLAGCSTIHKLTEPDDNRLYIPNGPQPVATQPVSSGQQGTPQVAPSAQYQTPAIPAQMTSREEKNKFTQLEEALRVLGIEVRNTANRLEETRASVPNSDQMNAQGASIARLQSALENVNITLENFEERIAKLEQHALEIDAAERLNASAKADAAKRAEMRAIQEKFSIHVASYRARAQAQAGWDILRNALSPILDAKNARVAEDNQSGVGSVLRLLVGPYDSLDEAARACAEIKNRASDQYCEATQYMGNALSNN